MISTAPLHFVSQQANHSLVLLHETFFLHTHVKKKKHTHTTQQSELILIMNRNPTNEFFYIMKLPEPPDKNQNFFEGLFFRRSATKMQSTAGMPYLPRAESNTKKNGTKHALSATRRNV